MPKYDPLTRQYAKWLFDTAGIDRYDWGFWDRKQKSPKHSVCDDALSMFYSGVRCWPQRLTRTGVQKHLHRVDKLYYTTNRKSQVALVCIDVDAHHGQTDALDAAVYIRDTYFPGSYLEASNRGYHLYVLVKVGRCRRWKFTRLLGYLESNLRSVLLENNFESTVDVVGTHTITNKLKEIEARGKLAPMPALPHGSADLITLQAMPCYFINAFAVVRNDAEVAREAAEMLNDDEREDTDDGATDTYTSGAKRSLPRRDSEDAWQRMQWVCFDFTVIHRRIPTVAELLLHYETIYDTDQGDDRRVRRAIYAIKYRAKTFDETCASEGGYELHREKLLDAVSTICVDRANKYTDEATGRDISDEDLAIGLYVIMRNSFSVNEDERRQWSTPKAAITAMFTALRSARLTTRACGNRNKAVAIVAILERSGLIECLDSRWVHGDRWGVGKKYVIGDKHWRRSEFLRFSQSITFVRVVDLRSHSASPKPTYQNDPQIDPVPT